MEEMVIYLEDSRRVRELEARAAALEGELAEMKAQRDRAEFRYRCEVMVTAELTDLCRAHGVPIRRALGVRPWEEMPGRA